MTSTSSSTISVAVSGDPAWAPVHPGEVLGDLLGDIALPIARAAARLGVSRQTLHRIIAGGQAVSPDMALRLGTLLGNGPGLWLRLQAAHDLAVAAPRMAAELAKIEPIAV